MPEPTQSITSPAPVPTFGPPESGRTTQKTGNIRTVPQTLGKNPPSPQTVQKKSRQTIPEKPLSSLNGTKKTGVKTDTSKVKKARIKARGGLPKTLEVRMPPSGRKVNLDSRLIARQLLAMPKKQRTEENAKKLLQEKIDDGLDVYRKILNDDSKLKPAKQEDVEKLMTFIYARGIAKAGYFKQGAFNLPDPGNRIRNYLDSCKEVYQRSSTHINGFKKQDGGGHRGIDGKFPNGMGTLLYGAMKKGVEGMTGDRIFLKLEGHGCRIPGLSQRDPKGPKNDRPLRFFSDLIRSLKHGWGTILTTLGLQKTEGTREERVPKDVVKDFKALVKEAKKFGKDFRLDELLNANNPAGKETARGIRTMVKNIETLLNRGEKEWPRGKEAKAFKEGLIQFLSGLKDKGFDHIEHRIGNEVIFGRDELNGMKDRDAMEEQSGIKDKIMNYIKTKDIRDRSALQMKALIGLYVMVVGQKARGLFGINLPKVNQKELDGGLKEIFNKFLTEKLTEEELVSGNLTVAEKGLANKLGFSTLFMKDFLRTGVRVNGKKYGGIEGGENAKQKDIDEALDKFVKAMGGKEQALKLSKLLQQRAQAMPLKRYLESDKTGKGIQKGYLGTLSQLRGQIRVSLPESSSVSIDLGKDGSATITMKKNTGKTGQLTMDLETQVQLSGVDTENPKIEDVKSALVFTG